VRDHKDVDPSGNSVKALAALPADAAGALESQWLRNTLAWLRLRELAAAIGESGMRDRVALI
jgi:hypothetical protein